MTPQDLAKELEQGLIRPVYLFMGEERYLLDRAVKALRNKALDGAIADFNEDSFLADDIDVDRALSAARTMPMMAARRFVLVRQIDCWESGDAPSLEKLLKYAEAPSETTCLVLVATKLDVRRRFTLQAKKQGFLVQCDLVHDDKLPGFVEARAKERNVKIRPEVARHISNIAGPDLSTLVDAVERLSLYVGAGNEITEEAVSDIVVKVREASAFSLVDAVGRQDRRKALALLAEVYDDRDRGLPLLGLLAWSVRQLLKFHAARARGLSPEDAAKAAGAPPFKARDLSAQARAIPQAKVETWLGLLSDADLDLKGGKRPPRAIFEALVLDLSAP